MSPHWSSASGGQRPPKPELQQLGKSSVAQLFRIFEKKRGERRTGSKIVGRIWEAAFFGVLFLVGAAALTHLILGEVMGPPDGLSLGFWLLVLVLSSFVLIGGSGVLWAVFQSGTSAE